MFFARETSGDSYIFLSAEIAENADFGPKRHDRRWILTSPEGRETHSDAWKSLNTYPRNPPNVFLYVSTSFSLSKHSISLKSINFLENDEI